MVESDNNMGVGKFDKAEDFFNKGEFHKSFLLHKAITENPDIDKKIKADSYNMMGALVIIDPRFDIEDETGLTYFIKSLEYDELNIGALLNVIETFGQSIDNHQNVEMLDFAIKNLKLTDYVLSERDKNMIIAKLEVRDQLLGD